MTVKECYAALGGNYDDVVSRLMNERLVTKFVLKFVDDQSFSLLENSLNAHDCKEAFRAAHTIKGICQNLAFTKLGDSAVEMTEMLREREEYGDDLMPCFEKLRADYIQTIEIIKQLNK